VTAVNSSIDQQFVEFVVKSLVNNPDAVIVDRRVDEKGVLLELTVDPEDLGRVIGKRGATAQSLRTLLRALGTKNDARYNLKIVDNGTGGHGGGDSSGYRQDSDQPVNSDKPTGGSDAVDSDDVVVEPPQEETVAEASEGFDSEPETTSRKEDSSSDRLSRTRAELDELDDLDI
jgi:uncharacterized protein